MTSLSKKGKAVRKNKRPEMRENSTGNETF